MLVSFPHNGGVKAGVQWLGEWCGKIGAVFTHPVALVGYSSAVGGMLR